MNELWRWGYSVRDTGNSNLYQNQNFQVAKWHLSNSTGCKIAQGTMVLKMAGVWLNAFICWHHEWLHFFSLPSLLSSCCVITSFQTSLIIISETHPQNKYDYIILNMQWLNVNISKTVLIHAEFYKTAENKMTSCFKTMSRADHYVHGAHVALSTAAVFISQCCAGATGSWDLNMLISSQLGVRWLHFGRL